MSKRRTKVKAVPWQPIVKQNGVYRWKANAICKWLVDKGLANLNELACQDFTAADRAQFAQLIGYSISGWGDLSYVRNTDANEAQAMAEKLYPPKRIHHYTKGQCP